METGSYGVISDMPVWRVEMLKGMGVAFSKMFPNQYFNQLPTYRDNFPMLFDGILCANQRPKGEVLGAFLDTNNVKPSLIIFFDDSRDNLQSVGECCAERSICCILFHYRGADIFSDTWDSQAILKQINILVHEKRWVSDQEIQNRLSMLAA